MAVQTLVMEVPRREEYETERDYRHAVAEFFRKVKAGIYRNVVLPAKVGYRLGKEYVRAGSATGTVLGIVITATLIIIGVIIFSNIQSSVDTSGLSTEAQEAINKTTSQTYSAFKLLPIGLIVLAASFIIGVLMALAAR